MSLCFISMKSQVIRQFNNLQQSFVIVPTSIGSSLIDFILIKSKRVREYSVVTLDAKNIL